MQDDADGEDDGKGKVRFEGGNVSVDTVLGIAYRQGAICEWTEEDIAGLRGHRGFHFLQHMMIQVVHCRSVVGSSTRQGQTGADVLWEPDEIAAVCNIV